MYNFLLDHAIRNVWCSPYQDDQAMFRLKRITDLYRAENYFSYQGVRTPLPTADEPYHVYVIGANSQTRLNLTKKVGVWESFSSLAVENNLISDFYMLSGLQLARSRCWNYLTAKGDYVIAIQMHDNVVDLDYQTVYLRVYHNSYFESDHDTSGDTKILVGGGQIKSGTEALAYQRDYLAALARPDGHAYAFVNGYLVDNFLPNEVKPGDVIEWVYDASISEVHDIPLQDMQVFMSQLDSTNKFILHLPKNLDQIQYMDDVDFWLIRKRPENPTRWRGAFYNRNNLNAVRMMTHRDYALHTQYVQDLIIDKPQWEDISNLYIRVHVRKSGYERPLIDEHQRIKELYKLTDDEIVRAMAGVDATVAEWQAASLESSNYTRIMSSFYEDITPQEVVHAYGYNAIAKLTGDSPVDVTGGWADVPVGCQKTCTAYEYDSMGLLIGWRVHPGGEVYYPMSASAVMVEFISGIAGDDGGIQTSQEEVILDPMVGYRFYVCPIGPDGQPNNKWMDVTGQSEYYEIDTNRKVVWNIDTSAYRGVVKNDLYFTTMDWTLEEYNHMYRLTLTHTDADGQILYIPPGRIDVFMNRRGLVENIDYHVNYPEILIYNKEFLKDGEQDFVIRGYGFCESDMTREIATQRGFVVHGMLSINHVYDLRDDKVIRVVVDGRTFQRDVLEFAEDPRQARVANIRNGRPYVIQDAMVPVRGLVNYDTYPLRNASKDVDKRVSDYLTLKLPEVIPDGPSPMQGLYALYSPFLARVLYDLWAGFIQAPEPDVPESVVDDLVQPYIWMLNFDPCRREYMDYEEVNIHAHPKWTVLGVTLNQYAFLERLNELYLFNKVDLTPYLEIVGEP